MIAMKHQQNYQPPGGECKRHKQPLVIFCNERSCQFFVCSVCIVTKHQGHKVVDIQDKADEMMKQVKELATKSKKMSDIFTDQVKNMKEAKQKLKNTASKALDGLDRTRALLYQQVDDAIETYKATVDENQQKYNGEIEEDAKNIANKKSQLEECLQLANQVIHDEDPSNVIKQSQLMITKYKELSGLAEEQKDVKTSFQIISFLPQKHDDFKEEMVGKLVSHIENISMPSSGFMPTKATLIKSWLVDGVSVASSIEGDIYAGVKEDNIGYLKSFDSEGNEKMCVALGISEGVEGLACANINGHSMIVVAARSKHFIQIRKSCDGQLINSTELENVPAYNAVCITPNSNILSCDWFGSKVTEYQVNNMKIVQTGKCLHLPISRVRGLRHVIHDTRQLVIASSYSDYTILAVDYHTGDVVWRIDNPQCEGIAMRPAGITSDGEGHLFISDYSNKRVCMMTPDGKIHHTLVQNNEAACFHHQTWIPNQRKLVIRDNARLYMYHVSYEK